LLRNTVVLTYGKETFSREAGAGQHGGFGC